MRTDTQKYRIQRGDLRVAAGEKIVGIKIGCVKQQQNDYPTEGCIHRTADAVANQVAKPAGES